MAGSEADRANHLIVGRIRRPHGVRGELQITVDTDRPRAVFRNGRSILLGDSEGESSGREYRVEGFRPTNKGAILTLASIDSREAADDLRGHTLLIPAADAAPASGEEVHYRDLIGMRVRAADEEIGHVVDILALPGGETLVIGAAEGKEILVPFAKPVVTNVDVGARVLTIDPPEGLLEL